MPIHTLKSVLAMSLALGSGLALAQVPINDEWNNRIDIPLASLGAGFNNTQPGIAEATISASDPLLVCKNGDPAQRGNTVWYHLDLSAQTAPVYLNSAAAGYDSVLAVFTGDPGSGFVPVTGACNDDANVGFSAGLSGVRLDPGFEYSIVVARPSPSTNVATLNFSARNAPRYVVTKTQDTLDGACDADCSLREAVSAGNAAPGAILLPAGDFSLTRVGNDNNNVAGDLDMSAGAGVYGVGASTRVLGLSGERVFDLEPANPTNVGSTFNFADLSIQNGSGLGPGAGINAANGNDHLALRRVLLENNVASLLPGGAVNSAGPSVLDNSVVRNNFSAGSGGGLAFGANNVLTRVDIFGSTINGNSSLSGSSGGGGGIFSSGNLFIYNSTLSDNRARFSGGGVLSTTFNGRLTLLNATLANNVADSDSNASGTGGGIRAEGNAASSFNSVLSGNLAGTLGDDCSKPTSLTFNNAIGNHLDTMTLTSTNCAFGAGNTVGVPALLGPLANNGGSTLTHKPQPGSPLIDTASAPECLGSDQRGTVRPQDGDGNGSAVCDKGAVELSANKGELIFKDGFESTQPAVIAACLDQTRPSRGIALGANVNALFWEAHYDDPRLLASVRSLGTPVLRVPGGTEADYFDWELGRPVDACRYGPCRTWDSAQLTPRFSSASKA